MSVTLHVKNGGLAGQTFTFNDPSIPIGRDINNLLKLAPGIDERASGRHCEIYEDNGAYYVRDLGSTNGTFLNNKRVTSPVPIVNGSLLKLGGKRGVEIMIELPQPVSNGYPSTQSVSGTQVTEINPVPGVGRVTTYIGTNLINSGSGAVPIPGKTAIGLRTLDKKLEEAKAEVRQEYSRRTVFLVAAIGVLMLSGAIAGVYFFRRTVDISGDVTGLQKDMTVAKLHLKEHDEKIGSVDVTITGIKDQIASDAKDYRESIASMAQAMSDKEKKIASLQVNLEQVSGETSESEKKKEEKARETLNAEVAALKTMVTEFKAYQDGNKLMAATVGGTFVDAVARNKQAIYAVLFKAKNATTQTVVGTAFAVDAGKGLLATSGNIGTSVKTLMAVGDVFAVCNEKPGVTYAVKKATVHERFVQSKSGKRSPDVSVLEVELTANGKQLDPFPATMTLANDADLDTAQMAQPVAMLSFPGEYESIAVNAENTTLSAKLAQGVISSQVSFAGNTARGRAFDILEHTCFCGTHDEGSPVFDIKGHVVAIQSDSESELIQVSDKSNPSKKIVKKLTMENVKYAVNVRYLKELIQSAK